MTDKVEDNILEQLQSNKSSRKQRVLELPPFELSIHRRRHESSTDGSHASSEIENSLTNHNLFEYPSDSKYRYHVKKEEITSGKSPPLNVLKGEETTNRVETNPVENSKDIAQSNVLWGYSEGSSTECDKEVSEINSIKSEVFETTLNLKSFELDSYLSLTNINCDSKQDFESEPVKPTHLAEFTLGNSNFNQDEDHRKMEVEQNSQFSGEPHISRDISNSEANCSLSTLEYIKVLHNNLSTVPFDSSRKLNEYAIVDTTSERHNTSVRKDNEMCDNSNTEGHERSNIVRNEEPYASSNVILNEQSSIDRLNAQPLQNEETHNIDYPEPPNRHSVSLLDEVIYENVNSLGDIKLSHPSPQVNHEQFNISGQQTLLELDEEESLRHNIDHGIFHLSTCGNAEIHSDHHNILWNNVPLMDDEEILNETPYTKSNPSVNAQQERTNPEQDKFPEEHNGVAKSIKENTDHNDPNSEKLAAESGILEFPPAELIESDWFTAENGLISAQDESFPQWLQNNGFRAVGASEIDSTDMKKKRASWEYIFDDDVPPQSNSTAVESHNQAQPDTSRSSDREYPSFTVISKDNDDEIEYSDFSSNLKSSSYEPQLINVQTTKDYSIDHLYLDALKILDEESSDYNIDDSKSSALVVYDSSHVDSEGECPSKRMKEHNTISLNQNGDDVAKFVISEYKEADYTGTSTCFPSELQDELDLNELSFDIKCGFPYRTLSTMLRDRSRSDQFSPSVSEFDMLFEYSEENDMERGLFLRKTTVVSKEGETHDFQPVDCSNGNNVNYEVMSGTGSCDSGQSNSQNAVISEIEPSMISSGHQDILADFEIPNHTINHGFQGQVKDFYSEVEEDSEMEDDRVSIPKGSNENLQVFMPDSEDKPRLILNELVQESGPTSLGKFSDYNTDVSPDNNAATLPLRGVNVTTPDIEDFKQELLKSLDDVFTIESIHNQQPFDSIKDNLEEPFPPPRPSLTHEYENTNSQTHVMPSECTNREMQIRPENSDPGSNNREQSLEPVPGDAICTCPKKSPLSAPHHQPHGDFNPLDDVSLEIDVETISNHDIEKALDQNETNEDSKKALPGGSPGNNSNDTDVVPLKPFGSESVELICPYCRSSVTTDVVRKPSLMFACCIAPLFVDRMKNVDHYCPQCKTLIGKYSWRPF